MDRAMKKRAERMERQKLLKALRAKVSYFASWLAVSHVMTVRTEDRMLVFGTLTGKPHHPCN